MQHYTYIHKTKDSGNVFYVGKGIGDRAHATYKRSAYWQRVVAKHGVEVEIAAYFFTAEEAFKHEKQMIANFKALGARLVNLTDGGEGLTNPSPELRKHLSEVKIAAGNKNNTQKIAIRCVELDKVFSSMGEAARWLGQNGHPKAGHVPILNCIQGKQTSAYGFHWHKADEPFVKRELKYRVKKVRCVETGEVFRSIKDIGLGNIHRAIKNNLTAGGFHWEYI